MTSMPSLDDPRAPQPIPPVPPGFEHVQRYWDGHLGHWSAKILPGEYYATRHGEAVATVLGSCIAACLRDAGNGIGGMNHFMLPEERATGVDAWSSGDGTPSTRYGAYAMESLINALLKLGARRERLELKLFGGGRILPSMTDIGARNIAFAREFAVLERLAVVAEDLGGIVPRHVIYFPESGRVLLKRLRPLEASSIVRDDLRYREKLADRSDGDDVELFQ